jgi:hypothetical protein
MVKEVKIMQNRGDNFSRETDRRGSATEAATRGRVAGTRSFSDLECIIQALFVRARVPTC